MKVLYRLLPTFFLVLAVDGLTKIWAEQILSLHKPLPVIGDVFRLTLGYNTGVAFGMFANGGSWPLIITGVIIIGLIVWFAQALYSGHFPARAGWPIGLLVGGAIGNFVDRLFDGRVTDFLDVGIGATRWPAFNVADSSILIGVTLLMLLTFSNQDTEENTQLDTPPSESASPL